MIEITKINNVYIRISAEESILREIHDAFSYKIPHYVPKEYLSFYSKKGMKKSLFNLSVHTFYIGLLPELCNWMKWKDYKFKINGNFNSQSFSEYEAKEFIKTIPFPFEIRDYQLSYFIKAVRNQRMIALSPTASGKSAIIYLITKFFDKKTLIVIPSTTLIRQLRNDFINYGCPEEDIHMIYDGATKVTNAKFVISTWQSLQYMNRDFFSQYEVVIGDEVHHFSADKTVRIMQMVDAPVRIGLTGSLTKTKLYDQQVIGLFGPVSKYVSTKELMDKGYLSDLLIKSVVLHHTDGIYWTGQLFLDYEIERDYLLNNQKRNEFITNLALSQKGNSFVMFERIDHGKELYNQILLKAKCPVYIVHGKVTTNEREVIINKIKNSTESITVCSRVFATGVDIPNLNNVILAHPHKSRTKLLQTIGRALRKHKNKTKAILIDLVDNLIEDERVMNTTYRHFLERIKIYKSEDFDVKTYNVTLNST